MAGSRWPVTPPGLEQTVRSLVSLRAISEWLHEWLVNGAAVHDARVCTRRALHALPRRQHDGTIRLWRVTEADAVGTWTTAELVYHLRFFSLPLPAASLSLSLNLLSRVAVCVCATAFSSSLFLLRTTYEDKC